MLQLSQSIINSPVMSLRTGTRVAQAITPIINPNNLKIEGFFCQDSMDKKKRLVLLYQDIRDIIPKGIVVDDHDALSDPAELVRLKDILAINFSLIGKPVITENGKRLGKVSDYALDSSTMYIQKLYTSQNLLKSFSSGALSIDRSRIVEITSRKIVVQDIMATEGAGFAATVPAA